jgi:hypothetical protein
LLMIGSECILLIELFGKVGRSGEIHGFLFTSVIETQAVETTTFIFASYSI